MRRWVTLTNYGWEEHKTLELARETFDMELDHLRDQSSSDWWDEDAVDRLGVFEIRPVCTARLVTTATAKDDSEGGKTCRERGWDYMAEAVVVPYPDCDERADAAQPGAEDLARKLARAERMLAVERGDVTAAPEGWTINSGAWVAMRSPANFRRVSHCRSVGGKTMFGWAWTIRRSGYADGGESRYADGEAPTALEAMEAADAAWEGRDAVSQD